MSDQFEINWVDRGTEPKNPPNPHFPEGIHIVPVNVAERSCKAELPYPAKRCGYFTISCKRCGIRVACMTAGRPDDPRSITINCKKLLH